MSEVELNPWQQKLVQWVEQNPEIAGASASRKAGYLGLPDRTFKRYVTERTGLDGIDPDRRMRLYEKTNIEELKVEGYVPGTEAKAEKPQEKSLDKYPGLEQAELILDKIGQQYLDAVESIVASLPNELQNSIRHTIEHPSRERNLRSFEDTFYKFIGILERSKEDQKLRAMIAKSIPEDHVKYLMAILNGIYRPESKDAWAMSYSIAPKRIKK